MPRNGKGIVAALPIKSSKPLRLVTPSAADCGALPHAVRSGIVHVARLAVPVAAIWVAATLAGEAFAEPPAATGPGLIVKLREAGERAQLAPTQRFERLRNDTGVTFAYHRAMAQGAHVVALPRGQTMARAEALAAELARHPDVEYAQVDRRRRAQRYANDELVNAQGYLDTDSAGISAFAAWDVTTGVGSTVVAVIDTGVLQHTDLAGRVLPGYDFVTDPARANDGGGRDADASDPGDWVSTTDRSLPIFSDCDVAPSSWHGSSIAGIIASNTDNAQWTAGINWAAKILPVRVLGKCDGTDSDILDGVAWAAGLVVPGAPPNPNPAHVINLSLGGPGPCGPAYRSVFGAALAHGITRAIIAAAGNESEDVANHAPANCPEAIAVASTTSVGSLARYSNFGNGIALSAPGGQPGSGSRLDGIIALSNAGATVPTSDSFDFLGGTSFAAPMVAGVASLMLGLAPNLTAAQIRSMLVATAKPFAATSTCSTDRCGAGIVDAYAAVLAAQSTAPANYQGLWWAAPADSESGWGISLAHQGEVIFVTWFTYDATGKAWWLTMSAVQTTTGTYSGTIYETTGPGFDVVPFDPARVTRSAIGTGTLTFSDIANGRFAYAVKGVSQAKAITREVFGPTPVCVFGGQANLALASNYQDLWWAAPANSESGWGISLAHQGDVIFATWFTYDPDGTPLWLSATAARTAPGVYAGTFYRTTGPAFDSEPFDPARVTRSAVGTLTLTFTDGNRGSFGYSVTLGAPPQTVSRNKAITRQVFRIPGTVCQ